MCRTTARERGKKWEREKEQMRIELPLGIFISSFTFSLSVSSFFSHPLVVDSLCLGNKTSIATFEKKKSP